MPKLSAGILVYRIRDGLPEVLLAHPGGPFWAKKDDGAWSVFKGEPDDGEELADAAKREFAEETGREVPDGRLLPLDPVKRKDGKTLHAWAVEADLDPSDIISNSFSMEWPPHSGQYQEFPENDRAAWFDLPTAIIKMHNAQDDFVRQLAAVLARARPDVTLPDLDARPPTPSPKPPTLF